MLKLVKKIIYSTGILAVMFSLPSCLKNGDYYIPFSSVAPSVDLPLAATNANGIIAKTYDATVTSASFPVYVNLASVSPLSTPTNVTLALDTAFLNQYNADNGTSFELLPDSVYTLVGGFDKVIPAGKRLDSSVVNLDLTKLDLSGVYMLPFTIVSADVAIEQWNHLPYYVSVKNQYDGNYTVTGTFVDLTNGNFTANYPMDINLVTSGPSSVDVFNTDLGLVGYEFLNAGSATYYGSFGVRINIDPASNKVTSVINVYGQPAANTRSAVLDPTGINARDPLTGDIDVKYNMTQPSVVPAPPNIRSNFNEHYKYNGPR